MQIKLVLDRLGKQIIKIIIIDYNFNRYGPPSMMHRIADLTIDAMLHLAINEFTTPERQHKLGVMVC